MDLRIKKTKRAIRSAFAELIKEKPMEKITVKEIAERAEINKTTFYAHYETVYDLVHTWSDYPNTPYSILSVLVR